jgi:hypothetical protein
MFFSYYTEYKSSFLLQTVFVPKYCYVAFTLAPSSLCKQIYLARFTTGILETQIGRPGVEISNGFTTSYASAQPAGQHMLPKYVIYGH